MKIMLKLSHNLAFIFRIGVDGLQKSIIYKKGIFRLNNRNKEASIIQILEQMSSNLIVKLLNNFLQQNSLKQSTSRIYLIQMARKFFYLQQIVKQSNKQIIAQFTMSTSVSINFCDPQQTLDDQESSSCKQRINTLWTKEENIIYINFLKEHRDIFTTEEIRRHNKVFIILSKFLSSRSSDQCRSHHQKMMISHKSIDRIIKHLEKKIAKNSIKKVKLNAKKQMECPREVETQAQSETVFQQVMDFNSVQIISNEKIIEEELWDVLA